MSVYQRSRLRINLIGWPIRNPFRFPCVMSGSGLDPRKGFQIGIEIGIGGVLASVSIRTDQPRNESD